MESFRSSLSCSAFFTGLQNIPYPHARPQSRYHWKASAKGNYTYKENCFNIVSRYSDMYIVYAPW